MLHASPHVIHFESILDFGEGQARQSAANVRGRRRTLAAKLNLRLFVPAVGGLFTVLVDVLDDSLEDQQIGAALARQLDAIAVVLFDRAAQNLAVV